MKTAWILATLLLLSGCTPTLLKPVPDPSTPVSTSSVPEEPEAPDSSSDASGAPEEQPEEPSSLPDAQPPASVGSSVIGALCRRRGFRCFHRHIHAAKLQRNAARRFRCAQAARTVCVVGGGLWAGAAHPGTV